MLRPCDINNDKWINDVFDIFFLSPNCRSGHISFGAFQHVDCTPGLAGSKKSFVSWPRGVRSKYLKTGQISTRFSICPHVRSLILDFQYRPGRPGRNFKRRKTGSKLHCKRFSLSLRPCAHEHRDVDESCNPDQWLPASLIQFAVGVALHATKGATPTGIRVRLSVANF